MHVIAPNGPWEFAKVFLIRRPLSPRPPRLRPLGGPRPMKPNRAPDPPPEKVPDGPEESPNALRRISEILQSPPVSRGPLRGPSSKWKF